MKLTHIPVNLFRTRGLARVLRAVAATTAIAVVAACGSTHPTSALLLTPTVSVSPASTNDQIGGAVVAFSASVANASSQGVTWQVDGVDGGNAAVGTISAAGIYTSPAMMPSSPTVQITAVSVADPTVLGSASVTLTTTGGASVSVAPLTATVLVGTGTQTFTATVANGTNPAVTWQVNGVAGGNSTVGTISAAGVYTAPATIPAQPQVTITATLQSDSTKSGTATATIVSDPPPTITGQPSPNAPAGQAYSFVPTASSPRGGTLSFSISNKPSWASFSNSTGTLSGTPAATDAGAYSGITITVSDGVGTSSLGPFSITVTVVAPTPPTISGTPATSVTAGQAYSFTPTASSPRGGVLAFAITNKPSWASFSTSSGTLSGTPTASNVGTFANITISVSDGTASASLAPFTITVTSGSTGSATVSWTPPTTRADGTTLTNLAGYKVYYGTTQGSYPNVITVNNAGLTSYVVSNLPGGATYYFVATAYDANGLESVYSNVGSKAIP